MSMMVWSPAPLSAKSVISVWRLSCQRPSTLAFLRTLFQAVLRVVTGRVGSLGVGLPKGNRYHWGCGFPNFSRYHSAYSVMHSAKAVLRGMVRPSPASVLL